MAKFIVNKDYDGGRRVEADGYVDTGFEGRWVDFLVHTPGETKVVLRLRQEHVHTVERDPDE